jgi:GH15 family glucan-1,4-alpha-glucosidase
VNGYLPIADHGLIGDLYSVALVGTDGSIDWYCCPRFDSPSVFASILDARRGGHYRLAPADQGWSSKQLYFPDTNVLITRFLTPGGVGEVEDFMPVAQTNFREHRQRLVRRVVAVRGESYGASLGDSIWFTAAKAARWAPRARAEDGSASCVSRRGPR